MQRLTLELKHSITNEQFFTRKTCKLNTEESEICKGDLHASVFTPQAVAIATMVRKVPPTLWILVAKGMKVFYSEVV